MSPLQKSQIPQILQREIRVIRAIRGFSQCSHTIDRSDKRKINQPGYQEPLGQVFLAANVEGVVGRGCRDVGQVFQ